MIYLFTEQQEVYYKSLPLICYLSREIIEEMDTFRFCRSTTYYSRQDSHFEALCMEYFDTCKQQFEVQEACYLTLAYTERQKFLERGKSTLEKVTLAIRKEGLGKVINNKLESGAKMDLQYIEVNYNQDSEDEKNLTFVDRMLLVKHIIYSMKQKVVLKSQNLHLALCSLKQKPILQLWKSAKGMLKFYVIELVPAYWFMRRLIYSPLLNPVVRLKKPEPAIQSVIKLKPEFQVCSRKELEQSRQNLAARQNKLTELEKHGCLGKTERIAIYILQKIPDQKLKKDTQIVFHYKQCTYCQALVLKYLLFLVFFVLLCSHAHGSTLTVSLNTEHETVWAGQTNAFTCGIATREVSRIEWLTNNQSLDGTIPGVTTHVVPAGTETIGILNIDSVTDSFHNVTFQCRAVLSSGLMLLSNTITLMVQGVPSQVIASSYLDGITIKVIWDAVSTLDIPNVSPDISYCVNISNSIGAVIQSKCGITGTSYEFSAENFNDIGCGKYFTIVCAVNPVGRNCSDVLSVLRRHLYISNKTVESYNSTDVKLITIHMFDFLCINTTSVLPDQMFLKVNIYPRMIELLGTDNFMSALDIRDEQWKAMATISTYDIQQTVVNNSSYNAIWLTSSFVHQSRAIGVFYGIISPMDIKASKFILVQKENAMNGIIQNISRGFYEVVSYDIESDNTISSGLPAHYNDVTVFGDEQPSLNLPQPNDRCTLNFEGISNINITCFCPNEFTYLVIIATFRNTIVELETRKGNCGFSIIVPRVLSEDNTGIIVFLQHEKSETIIRNAYFQDFDRTSTFPTEKDIMNYAMDLIHSAALMFLCLPVVVIFS